MKKQGQMLETDKGFNTTERRGDNLEHEPLRDGEIRNQQERLVKTVRLSAMTDAEGSLTVVIKRTKTLKGKDYYSLQPLVSICNTSKEIIDDLAGTLKMLGLGFNLNFRSGRREPHSDSWQIQIAGRKRVRPFVEAIEPYLVGKRKIAVLLMQLIDSKNGRFQNAPWSDEELHLANQIAEMNHDNRKRTRLLPESSETRRLAPRDIADEDIVRTPWRHGEGGRNDHPRPN